MMGLSLRGRLLAALAAAAVLLFLSLQPNMASDTQRSYLEHTAHCMALMIDDPAAHARECGPLVLTGVPKSLSEPLPGGANPAAPAPDPCANGAIAGGAGNAANAGSPCLSQTGYIAPLLSDFFTQAALFVWPPEKQADTGTVG